MSHLFLTGEIQVGKSTLLQKWLSDLEVKAGGFYTRKYPGRDGHVYVHMLSAARKEAPDEGNFLFDCMAKDAGDAARRFDALGCPLLDDPGDADLIVMDELGFMERDAQDFKASVLHALDGPLPVIGCIRLCDEVIHPRILPDVKDCSLISLVAAREDVRILEVTAQNRDRLAETLPPELSHL